MGRPKSELEYIKLNSDEEWKAFRNTGIGGSDAPAVLGLNPYKSALALYLDKIGEGVPFNGNLATEVGTYLEDFVAKKFEEVTGKRVRRVNFTLKCKEYPWALANVDRVVVGEDNGLEIKTTSELNLKKFKNGDYPANYYAQCMHYLAVTGKQKWYLAVLIGNRDFRIFEIERDEDEIKALMDAEKRFWDCVQSRTKPEIDGSQSSKDALNHMYPESNGQNIDLTPMQLVLDNRAAINEQIKRFEDLRDQLDNQIKSYIGDCEKGETGKYKVTWATQQRRTFDRKKYESETGTDLSRWDKVSSYRVFKVVEKK